MAVVVALLFLLLASPAAYAVDHIVGGSAGWTQSGDYTTWAAGEKFTAGDNLIFNYDSSHGVVQVSQADYTSCNTGNALTTFTSTTGSSTIPLTQAGPMYFACPSFGHCGSGMKLAITVQGSGGSGTTPSTPSGGSAPPTTPSTSDTTPANKPSSTNAAAGSFGSINLLMLGISGIMAALFTFQG